MVTSSPGDPVAPPTIRLPQSVGDVDAATFTKFYPAGPSFCSRAGQSCSRSGEATGELEHDPDAGQAPSASESTQSDNPISSPAAGAPGIPGAPGERGRRSYDQCHAVCRGRTGREHLRQRLCRRSRRTRTYRPDAGDGSGRGHFVQRSTATDAFPSCSTRTCVSTRTPGSISISRTRMVCSMWNCSCAMQSKSEQDTAIDMEISDGHAWRHCRGEPVY